MGDLPGWSGSQQLTTTSTKAMKGDEKVDEDSFVLSVIFVS
jgi:hypothetical protein